MSFLPMLCDFLNILLFNFDDFDKDYDIDVVAIELLSIDSKWPGNKTLKVSDLALKYAGLLKMAMINRWPTSHYPTILEDFSCFLFDIGTELKVNLGHVIFEFVDHRNKRKSRQKLPFHSLIYGVLATQEELQLDYENFTKNKSLVTYKLVEKANSKGEKFEVPTTNLDVTTSAPADTNSGPALVLLT